MLSHVIRLLKLSIFTYYWIFLFNLFNWCINFIVHRWILQKIWFSCIFWTLILIICKISLSIPQLFQLSYDIIRLIFLEDLVIMKRFVCFVFWKISCIFNSLQFLLLLFYILHNWISLYYTHYNLFKLPLQ
jgi:hypothetical protein